MCYNSREDANILTTHKVHERQITPECIIIHSCGEPKISLGIATKY